MAEIIAELEVLGGDGQQRSGTEVQGSILDSALRMCANRLGSGLSLAMYEDSLATATNASSYVATLWRVALSSLLYETVGRGELVADDEIYEFLREASVYFRSLPEELSRDLGLELVYSILSYGSEGAVDIRILKEIVQDELSESQRQSIHLRVERNRKVSA